MGQVHQPSPSPRTTSSHTPPPAPSVSVVDGPAVADPIGRADDDNHDHNNKNSGNNNINTIPSEVRGQGETPPPSTAFRSILTTGSIILTHSWINLLLVFVPAGIAVKAVPGMHGELIFAINCVAVIPLAGLLAFATESVASEMGDALGALMNVTFGNLVELIIL